MRIVLISDPATQDEEIWVNPEAIVALSGSAGKRAGLSPATNPSTVIHLANGPSVVVMRSAQDIADHLGRAYRELL